jgi:hypothetical protein
VYGTGVFVLVEPVMVSVKVNVAAGTIFVLVNVAAGTVFVLVAPAGTVLVFVKVNVAAGTVLVFVKVNVAAGTVFVAVAAPTGVFVLVGVLVVGPFTVGVAVGGCGHVAQP